MAEFGTDSFEKFGRRFASERLDELEVYMRSHPEEYPEYCSALKALTDVEQRITQTMGTADSEAFMVAHFDLCYYTLLNAYKLGFLDGSRIQYEVMKWEVPKHEQDGN